MARAELILEAVRRNPRIPAPSGAISRILNLTRDPDADIRAVSHCISRDAGLTIQLLKQANSSLYGCTTPTSSVNNACTRLGMKRVRAAVINEHVVSGLSKACPPGYDPNAYWQSALATSVAAFDLASHLLPAAAEDAGTAGLLCDIGIGMMTFAIPVDYGKVLKELNGRGLHLLDALERSIIGVTHAQIGAMVLADWKLDSRIIAAVANHHGGGAPNGQTSNNGDDMVFCGIVRAAATLAGIAIDGSDLELVDTLFTQAAELAPDAGKLIDRLMSDLIDHIQKTAAALSVEMGSTSQMEENFAIVTRPHQPVC